MKKLLCAMICVCLIAGALSGLGVNSAEADGTRWIVLPNTGEGAVNGEVTVTDEGYFSFSAPAWSGIGLGSGRMFPFDAGSSLSFELDLPYSDTVKPGEGNECHRYFAVVLSCEKAENVNKYGGSTVFSTSSYLELRFCDSNEFSGEKYLYIKTAGKISERLTDRENTNKLITIPEVNVLENSRITLELKLNGNDLEIYINGTLLLTLSGIGGGIGAAFGGAAYINFSDSAYGAAASVGQKVVAINGVAANQAEGTVDSVQENNTLNSDNWAFLEPESNKGGFFTDDGNIFMSSVNFGGIGIGSKKAAGIRNNEVEFELSLPVGHGSTGGAPLRRGFAVQLSLYPTASGALSTVGYETGSEHCLDIMIVDGDSLDGKKHLYVKAKGDILAFSDANFINWATEITNVNFLENPDITLKIKCVGNRDLEIYVNDVLTEEYPNALRGFGGEAYINLYATSYGSALVNPVTIKAINGVSANDFDASSIVKQSASGSGSGGCGNSAE